MNPMLNRPRANSNRPSRRGATTVEFALTAPLLFLLVLASIEFSRANVLMNTAKVAAAEGARRGIVLGTTADEIEQVVLNEMSMVGVAHADVIVNPNVVTDETEIVTVGINIPLDHRNGYVVPRFFIGEHVWKITAIPREAKNDPEMNKRLATSFEAMEAQIEASNSKDKKEKKEKKEKGDDDDD